MTYLLYLYLILQNVVCEGDIGDRLYIVFRGTVAGYTEENQTGMVAQVSYTVSECFGKVAAFFFDSAYDKVSCQLSVAIRLFQIKANHSCQESYHDCSLALLRCGSKQSPLVSFSSRVNNGRIFMTFTSRRTRATPVKCNYSGFAKFWYAVPVVSGLLNIIKTWHFYRCS